MQSIQNIVVYAGPNGSNDPSLERATVLAQQNQAHVRLVAVVEELPSYARMVAPTSWDIPGMLVSDREKELAESCKILESKGVSCEYSVLRGTADVEITRYVMRTNSDLLIKTARPEATPHGQWYGTLAKRLMRICPCPVWVLKASEKKRFERIMAAINPIDSDDRIELNTRIVQLASSLAELENAELHFVHAWTAFGEHLMRSRMSADQVAEYVEECRLEAQGKMRDFLATFDEKVQSAKLHLPKGNPEDALVSAVTENNCDLMVMGSVCRTGIAGYFIGNTAEKVLHDIPVSVLTVKPELYRSPLDSGERKKQAENA